MLVKFQSGYLNTDFIQFIGGIVTYQGNMYFKILMKDGSEHRFLWCLNAYVEQTSELEMKMELVRKELVKLANQSDEIIEIGHTIKLKKKEQIKSTSSMSHTPIRKMMAAKKV